ncbi:MAG: hypothetical protein ACT4QF_03710 [Sporichthyaceae bacterium]
MSIIRVHRRLALTAALALSAPLALFAGPAQACSCSSGPDPFLDNERRAGRALAVLTQTNDGGDGLELRVDRSAGPTRGSDRKPLRTPPPALPAVLTGRAAASGCGYVPFQGVKAVSPYPEKKGWSAAGCRDADIGDALQVIAGEAPATSTAEPVAVLAGRFGTSGLVAIDSRGEAVAWDRTSGRIGNLTACPGGRTVLSYDTLHADDVLTVRDARSLGLVRTLALPANLRTLQGLRCVDAGGTRAQVLVLGDGAGGGSLLFSVTEDSTSFVPVATRLSAPIAGREGFLGATADGRSLVRIEPTGAVRVLRTDFPRIGLLALSPDGRTLAGIAATDSPAAGAGSVMSFDASDGGTLASWTPASTADALAWTGGNRLLVRIGHLNAEAPYRQGTVQALDRNLRPVGSRPAAPGLLAAVGEVAVGYGKTRLSLTRAQGRTEVVENLWLAPTTHVVSLLDTASNDSASTDRQIPYVLGALGLTSLALALGARRGGRA